MNKITVNKVADEIYKVSVGDFSYEVTVSEAYWQKLTGGKISPEELIKKSFAFLLEREGPESILKQFDLPLIKNYFPDYEATLQRSE